MVCPPVGKVSIDIFLYSPIFFRYRLSFLPLFSLTFSLFPFSTFLSLLDAADIDVSVHDSIDRQGRHAASAKFGDNVFAVRDDRRQANVELIGYLLINIALDDKSEHVYFTLGEFLLCCWHGLRWQMLSVSMSTLLQCQELSDQLLFGQMTTDAMKTCRLCGRVISRREDDGLIPPLHEVIAVVEQYRLGNEEVHKMFLTALQQFFQVVKRMRLHDWHHLIEQCLHADQRKRVLIDYSYFRMFHD